MRYRVRGADRTTGQELTQTVQAKSPTEAEAVASFTMLVSEVAAAEPEPLPMAYAIPARGEKLARVNWAAGIASQSALLRWLSIGVGALGLVFLLYGAWGLIRSITAMMSYGFTSLWFDVVPTVVPGVLLISAAVLMRLAAFVALAVREIALPARPTPTTDHSAGDEEDR